MGNNNSSRNDKRGRRSKRPFSGPSYRHDYQATILRVPDVRVTPLPPSIPCINVDRHPCVGTTNATPASSNASTHLSIAAPGHVQVLEPLPSSRSRDWDAVPVGGTNDQAMPISAQTSGFFANASNFRVDHPIMGERVEVHGGMHYVQLHHHDTTFLLEKMKAYHVTIEAEFDSSDRENAPKCHPGTRTRFLEELKSQIQSGRRIIWLYGPAGVGKSAIMQSLAETLAPFVTCPSFFFSRPNSRNDPNKVFPTLAYRLFTVDLGYRRHLEERLSADPYFLAKTLEEQFKRLFTDPFANKQVGNIPRRVVFLDGLDEADGSPAQCRILDLIRDFVELDNTSSNPILWVISSRPEPHLQVSFSRIEAKLRHRFWKLEVPIDSDEAAHEVETYIRGEFVRIREEFSDVIPARWPLELDLLKVAASSSGLFVFASTCMAYIGDENPVHRLIHLVGLIDHYREQSPDMRPSLTKNPFELLDVLYRTIMDRIPTDLLPTTRTILGFYLLDELVTGNPPLIVACKILGYDMSEVYTALRGLHSVVRFPTRQHSPTLPLKFLHASFSDFLRDKSRSGAHWIDMEEGIRRVWRCYVQTFKQLLETLRPELTSLTHVEMEFYMRHDALLNNHQEHNWLRILSTHCHALPCTCGLSNHLILDPVELLSVFEEFSSVLFCRELKKRPDIQEVETWLFDIPHYAHAPPALTESLYRKTTTLDKFTQSDFDCILRGLRKGRPAYYSVFTLLSNVDPTGLNDAEWEEIKRASITIDPESDRLALRNDWRVVGDLMHLKKDLQAGLTIRILGTEKEILWAIIHGRFCNEGYIHSYAVFPYVEARNK